MRRHLRFIKHFCCTVLYRTKTSSLLLLFFILPIIANAQNANIKISGSVVDSKQQPLPGVTIKLKGTSISTVTDVTGHYAIVAPPNGILVFSYISFESQELVINGQKTINVKLKDATSNLNEVVVIGYGEVKRRDLTGSVGTVNIEDLAKAPVKSFDDALAGRVAGVEVVSPDGQPGANANIVIRGGNSVTQDNSPLYVIDGFPIENYNNNAINPADIESIDVLKDASSTAIYGSRGANGVIIITTKSGKTGAPIISYDGYYGRQNTTSTIQLMDPYNYVKYQSELNPTGATNLFLDSGRRSLDYYNNVPKLNWQDQIFKNASIQSNNFSLRGGNKETHYAISGNILDQQGAIIGSGFKRYQGRIVFDQNVGHAKIGLNVNYSSASTTGSFVSGTVNTSTLGSVLGNAWKYRPFVIPGADLDETLNALQESAGPTNYVYNPLLDVQNTINNRLANQLTANAYVQYTLSKGLTLKITGGIDNNASKSEQFYNSKTGAGSTASARGANGQQTNATANNYLNENTINYVKSLNGVHNINLLAGYTISGNHVSSFGARSIFEPNESLGISGLDEGTPYTITSTSSLWTLQSFIGRANYNYKSKYYLTGTIRADGSSKFAKGHQWGYFPTGAAAWTISEESFMKKIPLISSAKLRGSYGVTGNNRVGDFAYLATIVSDPNSGYTPGGILINGSYPGNLSNPNLKWETTYETDFGLDIGFLNQRILLTTDVYQKKTTDLLLQATLPTSSGFTTAYENIGSTQNRGLEFTLTTVNVTNNTFKWSSNFNISFNRNKLLSLVNGQSELQTALITNDFASGTPAFDAIVGHPVAAFYGFVRDGNYQYSDFDNTSPNVYVLKSGVPNNGNTRASIQPGDIKYKDLNGDGVVDNNDRTIIGNPTPKFSGGFSNNFNLKGFDLNVFFQYSYGNQILDYNKYVFEGNKNFDVNQFATYENRWTSTNQNNDYFRTGGYGPGVFSSRAIQDGSYLRLKTVNLGYTIPTSLINKFKIKSVRLYLSAQNLFTWTKYEGSDPEVSVYNSALTPGVDYTAYPRSKVYTLGLNVSF